MASFLDSFIGNGYSPSQAFNYGAYAANAMYPSYQGYSTGDADSVSAAIARMQEESDREYNLRKQSADQNYALALRNAKTQEDVNRANREYQQQQYQLARDKFEFDKQMQQQQFGLQQAQLGYNVLGTLASQTQHPADYFKAAENARGVAGMPGTSTFLSALANNARLPGFVAQAGTPQREDYSTLTAKLTGNYGSPSSSGSGTGSTIDGTVLSASSTPAASGNDSWQGYASNAQNYSNQIGAIAQRGAHQLGAGALEQLTPTERSLFLAGLANQGYDPDTFLSQYAQSRIGQSYGASRAA